MADEQSNLLRRAVFFGVPFLIDALLEPAPLGYILYFGAGLCREVAGNAAQEA